MGTRLSNFLDKYLPHRIINKAIEEDNLNTTTLMERLNSMSVGEGYDHLGELVDGEWHETERGVWSRLIPTHGQLSAVADGVSFIESRAEADTEKMFPHRHGGSAGIRNQIIYVIKGSVSVLVYESEKGPLVYTSVHGAKSAVHINPSMWHAVLFTKGTEILTMMLPKI